MTYNQHQGCQLLQSIHNIQRLGIKSSGKDHSTGSDGLSNLTPMTSIKLQDASRGITDKFQFSHVARTKSDTSMAHQYELKEQFYFYLLRLIVW